MADKNFIVKNGLDVGGQVTATSFSGDGSNLTGVLAPTTTPPAFSTTIDNPNPYSTSDSDQFGSAVAGSQSYFAISATGEDEATGNSSGKVYVFDASNNQLKYTLDNPNAYDTPSFDQFGKSLAMNDSYLVVGVPEEDEAFSAGSGKVYVFNTETGALIHTVDNPNAFGTASGDKFGYSVGISDTQFIVGASSAEDANGTSSGYVYVFDLATKSLVHTIQNPNAYDTATGDSFGSSVAIDDTYIVVGATGEDDAGGTSSGKAYIFDTTTKALLHTLDNPAINGASGSDVFGISVAISGPYVVVSASTAGTGGTSSGGIVYIFSPITGGLVRYIEDPNPYSTTFNDNFGQQIAVSNNYLLISAPGEDEVAGNESGKVYVYDITNGDLLYTLDNPNAYDTVVSDWFGQGLAVTGSTIIASAWQEDDVGGSSSGKAYVYTLPTTSLTIDGTVTAASFSGDGSSLTNLPIPSAAFNRSIYTATAGQTVFNIEYISDYADVFLNGVKLQRGVDYTATTQTSVTLTTGAALNDIVECVGYTTDISAINALLASDIGSTVQPYNQKLTDLSSMSIATGGLVSVSNTGEFSENATIEGISIGTTTPASGTFSAVNLEIGGEADFLNGVMRAKVASPDASGCYFNIGHSNSVLDDPAVNGSMNNGDLYINYFDAGVPPRLTYKVNDTVYYAQHYDANTAKLDVAQTWAAAQKFLTIRETYASYTPSGTTQTVDTSTGTVFTLDLGSATGDVTLTFSNPPTTGTAYGMTIKVIQGATARAITWPASVDWPSATAPTITTTNDGVDVFTFYTHDGGTTWYGFISGQALG